MIAQTMQYIIIPLVFKLGASSLAWYLTGYTARNFVLGINLRRL